MMRIAALDIGKRVGVTIGDVGHMPIKVMAVCLFNNEPSKWLRLLKQEQITRDEYIQRGVGAMGRFLNWLRLTYQPEAIVAEHYMSPAAMRSADAGEWQLLLHGALKGHCGEHNIKLHLPWADQVTKHFLGVVPTKTRGKKTWQQKKAMRDEKKNGYIRRAQLLGYIDKDTWDTEKADSAAIFDMACAVYFRSPIQNFKMFGARE